MQNARKHAYPLQLQLQASPFSKRVASPGRISGALEVVACQIGPCHLQRRARYAPREAELEEGVAGTGLVGRFGKGQTVAVATDSFA